MSQELSVNLFCRVALALLPLAASLAAPPALAASGPAPGFTLVDDPNLAFASPDGATKLEQYKNESDDDWKWRVYARRGDQMTELEPEQLYPAGFRFTNDSQWLVRMQKTGSGEQDLFLYHVENGAFVSATKKKSFSDLAWAYFYSRPDGKKMGKLDFHITANLVKGTEEAYRWLGVSWPDNRYLVISLGGELDKHPKNTIMKGLGNWRCRYDLKTGTFDVPAMFAKENAEALNWQVLRTAR